MAENERTTRALKSYVWHEEQCFFVSTIKRDSSAAVEPPAARFYETLAWLYDWETAERGELVAESGNGPALDQHFGVVRQLLLFGRFDATQGEGATG